MFDAVDVIRTKRDGGRLADAQIDWVIDAYTRGAVADEQMSALAMAIFLNGMDRAEIARWTSAMIDSGERMDFSGLGRPTVDKHSTGGVGDKITLPLAPLVAAFGVAVPQLSGRGLGHTGGTLDKLESIAGWRASMTNDQMRRQLGQGSGAVICAAGESLAPADRKLYALRDTTSTVDCIPLIASSIMSKKIAEGTGALVLDVKVGSGAFMKTVEAARELARTMVDLGSDAGVRTVGLLTDMSVPLGLTVGNALEVRESVEVLAGGGPADVVELTVALAREMLEAAGVDADPAPALSDGRAMDVWRRMIREQHGDPDAPLPRALHTHDVRAERDGVLADLDALKVGVASWRLGAGRARKEDAVQAGAGIEIFAKPGERVAKGQRLLTLHTDEPERFERAIEALEGTLLIDGAAGAAGKPAMAGDVAAAGSVVLDRIGAA
ncbi:MAG: thymidine phosphorylase [Actinomycetaceae bacterium]|nr:thymidine phosphorylase [Actinomycetaceae bacterium]